MWVSLIKSGALGELKETNENLGVEEGLVLHN